MFDDVRGSAGKFVIVKPQPVPKDCDQKQMRRLEQDSASVP